MIKGAIFDVDGTILDSMKAWETLGTNYMATLGITPDEEMVKNIFSMSLEESCAYIKTRFLVDKTIPEMLDEILAALEHFYKFDAQPKKGVVEFLQKLRMKGVPMVVATSSDKTLVESAFDRIGIRSYFKSILTCSDFQTNKREPLIFRLAAKELGAKNEQVYVFEDSLFSIKTAKEDGFLTVGVADYANVKKQEEMKSVATCFLTDFSDFDGLFPDLPVLCLS